MFRHSVNAVYILMKTLYLPICDNLQDSFQCSNLGRFFDFFLNTEMLLKSFLFFIPAAAGTDLALALWLAH